MGKLIKQYCFKIFKDNGDEYTIEFKDLSEEEAEATLLKRFPELKNKDYKLWKTS